MAGSSTLKVLNNKPVIFFFLITSGQIREYYLVRDGADISLYSSWAANTSVWERQIIDVHGDILLRRWRWPRSSLKNSSSFSFSTIYTMSTSCSPLSENEGSGMCVQDVTSAICRQTSWYSLLARRKAFSLSMSGVYSMLVQDVCAFSLRCKKDFFIFIPSRRK